MTTAPSANWTSVASSSNGSNLFAAVNGGYIYASFNAGWGWNQTSSPSANWTSVASSSDGSKLVAAVRRGLHLYFGQLRNTWASYRCTCQRLVICRLFLESKHICLPVGGSGDYTPQFNGQTATTSGAAGYLAGGQDAAIELQYVGNGQFLPLSFVGTITAH